MKCIYESESVNIDANRVLLDQDKPIIRTDTLTRFNEVFSFRPLFLSPHKKECDSMCM